jgi:hypothetical protein
MFVVLSVLSGFSVFGAMFLKSTPHSAAKACAAKGFK